MLHIEPLAGVDLVGADDGTHIVIKNLGEYLRNVKLFPGATIAPDGNLILLVDVNRLIAGESIDDLPATLHILRRQLRSSNAPQCTDVASWDRDATNACGTER